jgi:hypothetical protein
MSSANRVDLKYILEAVFGTTPATPALKPLRIVSEGLNANLAKVQSAELRSDRNDMDVLLVAERGGGNIDFELSYNSFDDFIEAVMCSTWVVDGADANKFTIVNGVVERSYSISKRFNDIAQYMVFRGSKLNTMRLTVGPGKITTGSFGIMSRSTTRTGTQIAGATFPAATTTRPYTGAVDVDIVQADAAPITGGLTNFTLDINNNRREQNIIGMLGAANIVAGRFEATGELEIYFEDGVMFDRFAANSAFGLTLSMVDELANRFRIDLPRVKLETGEVVAQGDNTDVMFRGTYRALYHAATLGSVKFTKDAA